MTEKELIERLLNAGAITISYVKDLNEIEEKSIVDVTLQRIICQDPEIRQKVASMFEHALEMRYPNLQRPKGNYSFGVIGTHSIAAIMGLLRCPIVTIAPDTLTTPPVRVMGRIEADYPFSLVDDLLKTGETISRELAFLLHLGYNISTVVVFYDKEIGGQDHVREEYKKLSRRHFGKERSIDIIVLAPRKKILSILK